MRLIDADTLWMSIIVAGQHSKRYKLGEIWELNGSEIKEVIDRQPTIEERKTGRWLWSGSDLFPFECDQCAETNERTTPWCPHCGARMEGEQP